MEIEGQVYYILMDIYAGGLDAAREKKLDKTLLDQVPIVCSTEVNKLFTPNFKQIEVKDLDKPEDI